MVKSESDQPPATQQPTMSTAPKAFASQADLEDKKITFEQLSARGYAGQANICVRRYGTRAGVLWYQPVNALD